MRRHAIEPVMPCGPIAGSHAKALAPRPVEHAELEYGRFTDGRTAFAVRQTTSVPDTVRVHAIGTHASAYWTLVLTNVGRGKAAQATWCGEWAGRSPAWKALALRHAFALFYQDRPRKLLRTAGGLR